MGKREFSKMRLSCIPKRDLNPFSAYGFPMEKSYPNFNVKEKKLLKMFVSDVISVFFSLFFQMHSYLEIQ